MYGGEARNSAHSIQPMPSQHTHDGICSEFPGSVLHSSADLHRNGEGKERTRTWDGGRTAGVVVLLPEALSACISHAYRRTDDGVAWGRSWSRGCPASGSMDLTYHVLFFWPTGFQRLEAVKGHPSIHPSLHPLLFIVRQGLVTILDMVKGKKGKKILPNPCPKSRKDSSNTVRKKGQGPGALDKDPRVAASPTQVVPGI